MVGSGVWVGITAAAPAWTGLAAVAVFELVLWLFPLVKAGHPKVPPRRFTGMVKTTVFFYLGIVVGQVIRHLGR